MSCAIWHQKKGWFCTSEVGGYEFSESVPSTLHLFDSVQFARTHFAKHPDKDVLEIYYPIEERGRKLFPAPS